MKKRVQLLSLLIVISFFSCNNAMKKSVTPISNLGTDFLVTEKLEMKLFNKYGISGNGLCVIDDSVLWYLEDREHDFGSCYDLNTGKELSVIVSRGEAANELIELTGLQIEGDSVLIYEGRNMVKTFAKKDIIDNIPMEDRKVSVATIPNDIFVSQMAKLPNGSVLATIRPAVYPHEKGIISETNKKSIAIFNNNEVKSYETIKYDSFDVEKAKKNEIPANDLIKFTYAQGTIEIKDDNMAVISAHNQFILYTLDLDSGNVVNEKRYTRVRRDGREGAFTSTNDMSLRIHFMKVNNKYILCKVDGYFSEEDKELELRKDAIFVLDWNLNPIKKFELPDTDGMRGYYTISNDCNSVYFCEYNKEGITLHKADLNI